MLGLSTHEPYFYIIRETIMSKDEKVCTICRENGHFFTECSRKNEDTAEDKSLIVRDLMVDF
jgi:5'-3' exoribonuclease 2